MEEVEVKPTPVATANTEVLELDITGGLEDFQCNENNSSHENENSVNQHDEEKMDKETLRKIKRKMKRSLNKRKKKLLSVNLKSFSATHLQQSVADLASNFADMRETGMGSIPVSSSFVNAPLIPRNGYSNEALQASNYVPSLPSVSNPPVSAEEITVCIMDSENPSYRMSSQDLACINDALEKFMYKDLTITPKLKICNSFLSWAKQAWIICQTQYTANWVIQKVKEMKIPGGRKFSACLANEISCLTAVTMLVPKECGFVDSYAALMRFLIIHNPTLGLGTTCEISHPVRSRIGLQNDTSINENSTAIKQESDGNDSCTSIAQSSKIADELPEKTAPPTVPEQPALGVEVGDLEVPRRARCFTFYADDTWLQELKLLTHGPFLGLRRLQFVLGERTVLRMGEPLGRNTEKIPANSKNLRGNAGGRNRKRRVPNAKDNAEVNWAKDGQ